MYLAVTEMQLAKVRFHETYRPGVIEFIDKQLRQASDLKAEGTAELRSSIMEIQVKGRVSVEMEADCDRCLKSTSFPIDTEFDLTYRPAASAPEQEVHLEESESDIGYYEGDGILLADVLREQILLSLPMQKVCSEACKGICPVCGTNRNEGDCNCHEQAADDRWAGLRNL